MSTLQRKLTRVDGLAIGVGSVIGVGIFRTSGEVLRGAGSVVGATAVWIAIGALSMLGAFVYADMALRVPEAGGPYAYVREAFGRRAAFVDGWFGAAISVPARQAAGLAVIGELLATLAPVGARTASLLALTVLFVINAIGLRAGANAQRVFTAGKLVTVAALVALAVVAHGHRDARALAPMPAALPLAAALAGAWYAYLGWQDVTHLVEELRDPARAIGPVLVGTVSIVLVSYLAVHAAVLFGVGDAALARGDMPARALAEAALGPVAERALTLAVLASMLGGAAEGMMVRPRLWFALARDGLAPRALAVVQGGGAPRRAVAFHCAIVLAMLLTGSFRALLSLLVVSQAMGATLEAASAIAVRRRATGRAAAGPVVFATVNAVVVVIMAAAEPVQLAFAIGFAIALFAVHATFVDRAPLAALRKRTIRGRPSR